MWGDSSVSAFMGGYIIVYGKLQVLSRGIILKPLGCLPPRSRHAIPWTAALGAVSAAIGAVYYAIHGADVQDILAWRADELLVEEAAAAGTPRSAAATAAAADAAAASARFGDTVDALSLATPIMFAAFAVVMAVISAIHSYLVVAFSPKSSVAKNVGFYYMANALGRLVGTMLSGVLYELTVKAWGISLCCWSATIFLGFSTVAAARLKPLPDQAQAEREQLAGDNDGGQAELARPGGAEAKAGADEAEAV
jgi:hypothetical protein